MPPASGHTNASPDPAGPKARVVLSVKKVYAGRGAVDYYLTQTRHGLVDYYLDTPNQQGDDGGRLVAPGSSWWGGGAATLSLDGEVERAPFVRMYAKAVRPDGEGYLGRKFRLPDEATAAQVAKALAAADVDDPYERWMARHEARRNATHASVAAWDCTFSPVKSVSLLWASGDRHVQQQVWAAHLTAVDAGLAYLEEHAAYVRAGRNGVRVLDTTGLVVARMNEGTSRDGDMQIHTHCLLLNRAETTEDSRWRALDGRALLRARTGAGAIYNRAVEAELTRRLGVAWRDRPDGLREIDGVDDDLIEAFSTRRRAITTKLAEMISAYEHKHGHEPPPAVISAMAQDATLKTRRPKRDLPPEEALARWEQTARRRGQALKTLPRRVLGRAREGQGQRRASGTAHTVEDQVTALLSQLERSGRATLTRHDLLRAALDVLPPGELTAKQLRQRAEHLVAQAMNRPELLAVTAPDPLDVPEVARRRDGSSVYCQPEAARWALRSTLDEEAWLLDVAGEPTGRHLDANTIGTAITANGLGTDQARAAGELLGSERRVGLLVGPAGAGKTRTLRAVVDAWQQSGGEVIGLTVSQAAAGVLATEARCRAENTAKWLYETRRGRWQLPAGALVLVDEASMVSTSDLVDIVAQARQAGGKVLLVGDPAQLAAIHIGGAFDLLADRHGACHLEEIRRFSEPWEREASRRLRRRDPVAIADYAMRGRVHGGALADIEAELFAAWQTDALGTTDRGRRRSVLMIVATNEQAAVMSERARNTLIASGTVADGPTVRLRDNVASVGDYIVTRRNDRRLRTSGRGFVVNGDLWTITEVHPDGGATVRRHADAATITLPVDYLAAHAHLAYATTAHRAQGMTVDVCHAAITADASHEGLYVAATRGREANHLWVIIDSDRDLIRDPSDLPAPEEILSRVLARRDPDRISAHQALEDSQDDVSCLARVGAIFEDAARTATDRWLRHTLSAHGLASAADDPEWPSLVTRIRHAALAGNDVSSLVDQAARMRELDDAHSTAAVIHWRLGVLTPPTPPGRRRGPLASLPPIDGPETEVARQAGELIRQRWQQIRQTLDVTTGPLPWAPSLGVRPAEQAEAAAWLTAATAVAAYRERYETPDHTPMLGPRPSRSRPDAQAAWDHARHQADCYLARRLRDLDDLELAGLDDRMKVIIAARPILDPAELEDARRALDQAERTHQTDSSLGRRQTEADRQRARQRIDTLERAADAHRRWRDTAKRASATRRQIALEQRNRTTKRRPPSAQTVTAPIRR
jgi:conjugative relaxase-like TrwC/TraI family protein